MEAYPAADFPTPQDALVRVWGDYRLGCPTDDSARRFAAGGAKVFTYAFKRTIPGLEALGPTHGTEMPYVFGTLPSPASEDAALIEAMQSRWVHFATAGDPNAGSAPSGPVCDEATDERMMFDVDPVVEAGCRRAECSFWRMIYDAAFP